MTRIGILGGTFDPIHFGHLRMAEEAREAFELDTVLFIPARMSPLKAAKPTEDRHRTTMVDLAIKSNPAFDLNEIELRRDPPSYTIDTLCQLQGPSIYLLLGTDAALDLPRWREPSKILDIARVVAFERPGDTLADLQNTLPPDFVHKMQLMPMLPIDIAATDIRDRLLRGLSVRYLTPDPVVDYIAQHRLYQSTEGA